MEMLAHPLNRKSASETHLMGSISPESTTSSRGLEVMPGRKLGDGRLSRHNQSFSGKTSGYLASVHMLPTAPDTEPQPLTSTLLLPVQPVLCLLALPGKMAPHGLPSIVFNKTKLTMCNVLFL